MPQKTHLILNVYMEPNKETTNKRNKWGFDLEVIIPMLIEGKSYRAIAEHYGSPLATLHDYCNRNTSEDGIEANSPRARIAAALYTSADTYAEKAEQVLLDAENRASSEVHRANYLSCHYRWMASKRNPKVYANTGDVNVNTGTQIIKVGGKKDAENK